MRTKRIYYPGLMLLLLTLLLLFSAFSSTRLYASSLQVQAHSAAGATTYPASAWTAATTNWANVRIGPGTNYDIANTYAPGTSVTIYATVSGEVVWNGISNWYRISSLASSPLYIYSGLVSAPSSLGDNNPSPPSTHGKVIVVNIARWPMLPESASGLNRRFRVAVSTRRRVQRRRSAATPLNRNEADRGEYRQTPLVRAFTFVSCDSLSRVRAETACHRICDPHPRWHLRAAYLDTYSKAHRDILRMKARLFCRAH